MARVIGVDLPRKRTIVAGLQQIYGIGETRARQVLAETNIDPGTRVSDLSDEDANRLTATIQTSFTVEGDLRRETMANIKRLMDINCYRGIRHKRGLPVRGQKTCTNARTRKGPRRTTVRKK